MRTNIDIDDKLMKRTLRAAGTATKRAAVEKAMKFFVEARDQEKALERLWGAANWQGNLEESRLGHVEE